MAERRDAGTVGSHADPDDDPADRLQAHVDEHGVDAEVLRFDEPVRSVKQAAEAAGAAPEDFIKSLCLMADGDLVVCIVRGTDRADLDLVAEVTGAKEVRMAKPDEVLEATGYPVGGVPPFGFEAPFYLDEAVMGMDELLGGGGSDRALIRTRPGVIAEANGGEVVRVRAEQ